MNHMSLILLVSNVSHQPVFSCRRAQNIAHKNYHFLCIIIIIIQQFQLWEQRRCESLHQQEQEPPNWSLNKLKRSRVKWRKLLRAPSADALICVSPPETLAETLSELPFICISCRFICCFGFVFFFACCWQTKWKGVGWKYFSGLASSEFTSMDQAVKKGWAFTVGVFSLARFPSLLWSNKRITPTRRARTHTHTQHIQHISKVKVHSAQCWSISQTEGCLNVTMRYQRGG